MKVFVFVSYCPENLIVQSKYFHVLALPAGFPSSVMYTGPIDP